MSEEKKAREKHSPEHEDVSPSQSDDARPDVSHVKDRVHELMHEPESGRIIKLGLIPREDIEVGKDGRTQTKMEPCPERGREALATSAVCACGQKYIREGSSLVHPDDGMISVAYYRPPSQAVAYTLTMVVRGDGPRQIWGEIRLEFRRDGTARRNGTDVPVEYALRDLADPLRNANCGKEEYRRASAEVSAFETL